ncbi:cysteine desulfurase NifS [Bacillus canaveralius]|uniref:Cysteine desulfurase NifS n=1 Tax=Bacillus canaveralius TaxID=1403243 RepID=A0A2N5GNA6_9BACI|nr:cysteine desulfurase family protein [Bacillus canaveralius]PLR83712.1 cysteine desulfurase NifS [Bacillus canaveralius]PLR95186.1 cysteine desulfurase NifS [Bacillus canaveralius]RSK48229.1 cysteine desulfurase [Bacillus canaveralius]
MIYFDNSATTKPYKEVLDSYVKVSSDYFGNPSSLHSAGAQAEKLLSRARAELAKLMNVKANEIYFTSGGTEGNNLAIKGAALAYKGRGRHIITTQVEHTSVREAIEQLKRDYGFNVTYIAPDSDGRVRITDIEKAITDETMLVSVIHVNNEVGTIQPICEIGHMLKNYHKIIFHVDHVQGIGKVPLDMYECGIGLCTISGHKFHGLKGTGALFVKGGLTLSPLFSGGNQESKIRSGTENVAGMVAMAKAMRMTFSKREEHLQQMEAIKEKLREELQTIVGVKIHTPRKFSAPHILNFSIKGFKAEVFVHALEEEGVYVSTTSACSSKQKTASSTLLAMGVPDDEAGSAVRISLSYDNTVEEAGQVIDTIKNAIDKLGRVMN